MITRNPVSIAVAASALALAFPLSAGAQEEPFPRIAVTGEGSAEVAPDMAVLNLTVTREAKTARAALDANNAAMGGVLDAMKAEGIEDRDLQTTGFSIQPQYVYPNRDKDGAQEGPRITGYIVRNSLTVRVRDLDGLGAILDKSVTLGVNEGGNVSFTNDDPEMALAEARTDAVEAAVAKARTLAEAAGVSLGKVLEISEQSNRPQPVAYARMASMEAAPDARVPMAAGENSYSVTVNVSFAIDQ